MREGGLYTEVWKLNGWEEAVSRTDGEGNERRWRYNGAGKPVAAIDGYGEETRYSWNAIGKIEKISYPDGGEREYDYNELGLVTKISDGEGIEWEGRYDGAGRLEREKGRPGIDREYKYDGIGRIIEVRSGGDVAERYSYGERGRKIVFTDGAGNGFRQEKNLYGEITGETNRLGDRQGYAYDKEGRLTKKTAYSGKVAVTEYQDNTGRTTTEYADGRRNVIERDNGGKIIRVTGETGSIRYRYDGGGRLILESDEAAGETAEYSYDKAGRRIRMASGNRSVRYVYGKNGELLNAADSGQRLEVSYGYDKTGREIRRTYRNGVKQETFYDKAGRAVLIREINSGGDLLRAEGYVYDEAGRRKYSVNEGGKVTVYEYDRQSRLESVLYPFSEEKSAVDRREAEEAGLFFSNEKGRAENYVISGEDLVKLRGILDKAAQNQGALVTYNQTVWRESYSYDKNGNRAAKTTPWGTIRYGYDAENRLITKGNIEYGYDKDGNLLAERGAHREARYGYNGENRMAYSEITENSGNRRTITEYFYDALGRRTVTRDAGSEGMRVLYDGFTFEGIREGVTFGSGGFTTGGSGEAVLPSKGSGRVSRYRYIEKEGTASPDGESVSRHRYAGEAETAEYRYLGINVTLYANGEAVGMNRLNTENYTGGSAYLGKDVLGSVRCISNEYGQLEGRYEYDAFGKPYKGDFTNGVGLGYTGKPYDTVTGMYNYGYRDYAPEVARFTTVDPVRDGANWFAYVNNDPVNYVDPWGLQCISASDKGNIYSNSSTFTTFVPVDNFEKNGNPAGYAVGLFSASITTTVVVDEKTNTANVFSISSKSVYEVYDVKSKTEVTVNVNVNGFEYDSKVLTDSPSLTRTDQVSLGSTTVNIPQTSSKDNIIVTTSTSYIIDTGSGFWAVGSQNVNIPIK